MRRIILMVIRNFFRVPIWFYKICRYGRPDDTHTEQERYDLIRRIVMKANRSGRVKIEVHNPEQIPTDNGFILFPNHQGLFDVLALIEACSHPLSIVVKKEASNIILVKQVIAFLRGMSIDRQDVRSSMKVISNMTDNVKNGRNYIIFAEGTRSKNGNEILEFKAGTFKSAVNASCPIVPVALIDSFKPFDYPSIRKETVKVCFLPPIMPEEYKGMKTVTIADIVERKIAEKISELT